MDQSAGKIPTARIVEAVLNSGLLDPKATAADVVKRFSGLEEVAGYVLAWDRYVLVVPSVATPDIVIRQQPGR